MIYFILVWIVLIVTTYPIGLLVMDIVAPKALNQATPSPVANESQVISWRWEDRWIASIWLGISILAVSWLAISSILPLSPLACAGVAGFLVLLSLLSLRIRDEVASFKSRLSGKILFAGAILIVIAALLTARQVTWIESGFYHYGATRWLAEYGAVKGLVLLLPNFGIVSSWFALNAPFNASIINFQAGAIANGFIFWLVLLHFVICISHLYKGSARLSDRFALSFYTLFLLFSAFSEQMQLIIVSLSPDLPIILFTGIVGWSILIAAESHPWELAIVPLLLAASAVTIKLSALPLLLITGLFYAFRTKFQIKPLLVGTGFASAMILPAILVGYQTSGCPLYPASLLCIDVPWSLSFKDIARFADNTQNPAAWVTKGSSAPIGPLEVFWRWLNSKLLNVLMTFLGIISLLCAAYVLKAKAPLLSDSSLPSEATAPNNISTRFRDDSGILWLVALGILGILFVAFKGPLIRFALGYLLVLPALSIAIYSQNKPWVWQRLEPIWRLTFGRWQRLRAISLGFLATVLVLGWSYGGLSSSWLLPPQVASITSIPKQVNDIKYIVPAKGPCWASPLPCVSKDIGVRARLRQPNLGIGGGFVRAEIGSIRIRDGFG